MKRHTAPVRRHSTPWVLVTAGLAAQLVGVATQGLWHGLLAGRTSGAFTEGRAFWIDHTISNAGVACVIVGGTWLYRRHPGLATGVVLAGAAAETLGALLDAHAHVRGSENPVALGIIGVGFLLAGGGTVAAWRTRRGGATRSASQDREQGVR